MEFGAFINIIPGLDGMLHISQISETRIAKVEDALNVGDKLQVKVVNIDDRGKIDLSRPELEGKVPARAARPSGPRPDRGGGKDGFKDRDRGPRR
jgi:polyribonucleotide nucleotidyltransferase